MLITGPEKDLQLLRVTWPHKVVMGLDSQDIPCLTEQKPLFHKDLKPIGLKVCDQYLHFYP